MAGKGAPKGNKYSVTHGLALVRNQINRRVKRGRSYVDKRTQEGQEALAIEAGLIDDHGGVDAITTAKFIAIRKLARLHYRAEMMHRAIAKFLRENPHYKDNPKVLTFAPTKRRLSTESRSISIFWASRQSTPACKNARRTAERGERR
jgi:hypothetical protein